jgi:hypothetical protein
MPKKFVRDARRAAAQARAATGNGNDESTTTTTTTEVEDDVSLLIPTTYDKMSYAN